MLPLSMRNPHDITELKPRFIKCTLHNCNEAIQKESMDEHIKKMHTDVFCEICGKSFSNKKAYHTHYAFRHYRTRCKVCKIELFQYQG